MKKITDYETLENSKLSSNEYHIVKAYLKELFELYNIDSIKNIGCIYIIENKDELSDFKAYELTEPISTDNMEFIDKIFLSHSTQEPDWILACFLVDTDYCVYLLFTKNILSAEQQSIFSNAKTTFKKFIDLEEIK